MLGATGKADPEIIQLAYELGQQIAPQGWVLLTGGRNIGVMDAASRGAKEVGGLTLGILPGNDRRQASAYLDIAVVTDLGNARNNVNVLTSDVVVCCGMGLGTLSEIALATKQNRHVMFLEYFDNK
ncbi:MAG: TIGR00725 family protein [Bacteroidota bacterium]